MKTYQVDINHRPSNSAIEETMPMSLPGAIDTEIIDRAPNLLAEQNLRAVLKAGAGIDELFSGFNSVVLSNCLAELIDLITIPIAVVNSSLRPRMVYGNPAWNDRWGDDSKPSETGLLSEILGIVDCHPLLSSISKAGETAQTVKMRDFRSAVNSFSSIAQLGRETIWDWDVLPIRDSNSRPSNLLVILRERTITNASISSERATPLNQEELTTREQEVAELIAQGMRNPVIANRLHISRTTVASHVTRILQKLGFSTRAQIAAWVVERRLWEQSVIKSSI